MITRKLLAALVGLSLAAGTVGTVSAQTAQPTIQSASPSDAVAPATPPKAAIVKKVPTKHTRMTHKAHRKHLTLRSTKGKLARHSSKHGSKLASTHGVKLAAKHVGKRVRVSHVAKRGVIKHV